MSSEVKKGNTSIDRQRELSIASLQSYQTARALAAKKSAHSAPEPKVETPAQIAVKAEHDAEVSASVAALHRLQEAQAEANEG
jgi:hypothetical protein